MPSEHCAAIFKKHMKKWEEIETQATAKAAEEAAKAKADAAEGLISHERELWDAPSASTC